MVVVGVACLGERERRWRGLGVEDGYGRTAEREGEVDMGRRWRTWWRLGEQEWLSRGLGVVDGYGRRGERGARRGLSEEGGCGHGAAVALVVALGGAGAAGAGSRGSWWHLGERERRELVVEARWRCGECGRRRRVCRAGGERESCRLRDRASSLESHQSGGVGGSCGASRGAAWYWGGGVSPVVHGSAT